MKNMFNKFRTLPLRKRDNILRFLHGVLLFLLMMTLTFSVYAAWVNSSAKLNTDHEDFSGVVDPDFTFLKYVNGTKYADGVDEGPVDYFKDYDVVVQARILNLDMTKNELKVRYLLYFVGDTFSAVGALGSYLNKNITFSVELSDQTWMMNGSGLDSQIAPKEVTHSFETGDINRYPFDSYVANLIIFPYWRERGAANDGTEDNWSTAKYAVQVTSDTSAFNIKSKFVFDTKPRYENGTVDERKLEQQKEPPPENTLILTVDRTATTIGFSVAIMLITWGIGIALSVLTFDTWLRNRTVELPMIIANITALFALPALRNTQPNAPPIGCASDLLSLFWVMLMVVFNAVFLLFLNIHRWIRPPAPAPAPAPAPTAPPTATVGQSLNMNLFESGALPGEVVLLTGDRSSNAITDDRKDK